MRWSLLVAVFGLSTLDVASFAQGRPAGDRLSTSRSGPDDSGFFASAGVVRFQLVQGRLCLDCLRHRKGSQSCEENGVFESITVTAERGIPSLHYVCQSDRHQLTLSVQEAQAMRIESWFPQSGERAVLDQPAVGELTWQHTHEDHTDHYQGINLLHLRHANPEGFDHHFGWLIQRLLRGESLQTISDSTQQIMLQKLPPDPRIKEAEIRRCVEQLRASRRAMRIDAERRLLAWGTPIVPSLRNLLQGDLDAEQRERLRHIIRRLRPMIPDTPATLAKLLMNDHAYWSRIAGGLTDEELRLANRHLTQFGAQPIDLTSQPVYRIARP